VTSPGSPSDPHPLNVGVVSASDLVSSGIARLLALASDEVSVREVSPRDRSVEQCDVAVYDLALMTKDASSDLSHLVDSGVPVVGLEPPVRPDMARAARRTGVVEVIRMDVDPPGLLLAIRAAASVDVADPAVRRGRHRASAASQFGLSSRELDILELIGSGLGNEEIARSLYLSINSVKSYIRTAYRKIDVSSRSLAVLWTVDHHVNAVAADHPGSSVPDVSWDAEIVTGTSGGLDHRIDPVSPVRRLGNAMSTITDARSST
jgi:DNA-binding NarL/FixJ family response regulator